MKHLVAGGLLMLSSAARATPGLWVGCSIDAVSICTVRSCESRKPEISIYLANYTDLGVERAAYYRCALRLANCDRYNAVAHRTGDYVVFSVPEHSAFAKVGSDGHITDVAAVGDQVYISRGMCKPAAPPGEGTLRSR
jgi:hypothetical protein